jgi:hypothetical protein
MASENPNDRRGHMLNGSALRLQPNEIGLVNHARKCMPGAEVCQGPRTLGVVVRSAVAWSVQVPLTPKGPRNIASPSLFPSWPSTPEIRLLYQKTGSFRRAFGVGFGPGFRSTQITFVFGTGKAMMRV